MPQSLAARAIFGHPSGEGSPTIYSDLTSHLGTVLVIGAVSFVSFNLSLRYVQISIPQFVSWPRFPTREAGNTPHSPRALDVRPGIDPRRPQDQGAYPGCPDHDGCSTSGALGTVRQRPGHAGEGIRARLKDAVTVRKDAF